MLWKYNDGGRSSAGFKGTASDCVTRAIAISTGVDYKRVYDRLNELAKQERPRGRRKRSSSRTGVHRRTYEKLLVEELGWVWTPTMQVGSGCQVHLSHDELPSGTLVVSVSRHVCAVKDGVVLDTHDPSREDMRCVYGYYVLG